MRLQEVKYAEGKAAEPVPPTFLHFQILSYFLMSHISCLTSHLSKMPYKEREIEKQYFTIGEVAAQFNVAPSLIRFWETEFEELRPRKSKKGNRLYTPQDVDIFRTIYHLVKERGYTIPGARELLKQKGPQLKEKIDVIQSLEKVRKFMVQMKKELDAIGKAQG